MLIPNEALLERFYVFLILELAEATLKKCNIIVQPTQQGTL